MAKWADYVIVGVRYNDDRTRIVAVKRRPDLGEKLGDESREGKDAIIDDIRAGRAHVTAYLDKNKREWREGEAVRVVSMGGTDFIQTNPNTIRKDNLGELPEF